MMSLKSLRLYLVTAISLVGLGIVPSSQQEAWETKKLVSVSAPQDLSHCKDVPFLPTANAVVQEMLRIAQITQEDVVYDLGSGDGRIVISAAKNYGARGVGVEIDPALVQQAKENARQAGVSALVEFRQQDLFEADLSDATVVTLYLLPEVNLRLRPKLLRELRPGTRIVSHAFDLGNWKPQQVVQVVGGSKIYYWVVPQKIPEDLLEQP